MPKYLLAPEVAGLLHYLPDWNQHAFINTLWNTGARLNEALALRRRDFHLNDGSLTWWSVRPNNAAQLAVARKRKKVRTG